MKTTISEDELYFRMTWNHSNLEARQNFLTTNNIEDNNISNKRYSELPEEIRKHLFETWLSKKIIRVH